MFYFLISNITSLNKENNTGKQSTQAVYEGIRKNSKYYKAKKVQLSNKSVKELKLKTPEAFVHSSKVWRKNNFIS